METPMLKLEILQNAQEVAELTTYIKGTIRMAKRYEDNRGLSVKLCDAAISIVHCLECINQQIIDEAEF